MRIGLADTMKGETPQKHMLALMAGHPYRLVSYFYLRKMRDPGATMRAVVHAPSDLIVDSGLYSFMFGSEQGKMPATYEAYRDYTLRYLEDMDKWGFPCFIVEADTHRLLGMDATHRLRELFKPLGSRVMYVWHRPEGLDGLIKLAKEKDYIGIGFPELRLIASGGGSTAGHSEKVNRMCMDLLKRVHEACGDKPPRIHLLGCTIERMMETRLAWSCDSTSWLSGIRFGQVRIWTHTGFESVGIRSPKFLKFRQLAMDTFPLAVDYANKQSNPEYYLACLACAHTYSLYQKWLDSRYSPVPMRGDALPEGPINGRETKQGTASVGRTKDPSHRRDRTQPVEPKRAKRLQVPEGAGLDQGVRLPGPGDGAKRTRQRTTIH